MPISLQDHPGFGPGQDPGPVGCRWVVRALATVKERVKLHSLLPYCPDHIRIERVWEDGHAHVTRNHRCQTLEELRAQVKIYLDTWNWRGRHCYPKAAAI